MKKNKQIDRHLSGNYAPVRHECNLNQLEISGKVPDSLLGTYYCIGANPQFDPIGDYFWFTGDGMVHAIDIGPDSVSYCNRWVRTDKFIAEQALGEPIFDGMDRLINTDPKYQQLSTNSANTNIIMHANQLQALNEGALPMLLDQCDLSTHGPMRYDGMVADTLTAHPRFERSTGYLHTYSYLSRDEKLRYYCIDSQGKVIAHRDINWPYACMMHDFIITENYCIFPCFPVTYNIERMLTTGEFFKWEPNRSTFFGIMSRQDLHADVIWIEFDACQVMHFSNAFEHGNTIIIDAFKYPQSPLFYKAKDEQPMLTEIVRWSIDLTAKKIKEHLLDQCRGEFPRFDERLNGLPYQYGYFVEDIGNRQYLNCLSKVDFTENMKQSYCFNNDGITEPVFIAGNPAASEDEGYLMMMHYHEDTQLSSLDIFSAQSISDGPIASINLPCRVPYGFHGNWVARS